MLAFTFTERAAGELKRRIRAELGRRADAARDPETARSLRSLARDSESAWISTIHSFCRRVLASHPIAAGLDPSFQVLDEASRRPRRRRGLRCRVRALRRRGRPGRLRDGGGVPDARAPDRGPNGPRRAAEQGDRATAAPPDPGRRISRRPPPRCARPRSAALAATESAAHTDRSEECRSRIAAALSGTDGRVPRRRGRGGRLDVQVERAGAHRSRGRPVPGRMRDPRAAAARGAVRRQLRAPPRAAGALRAGVRDAQGGALRARLRGPAATRTTAASRQPRHPAAATRASSGTSWSTSSRTRTRFSSASCGCCTRRMGRSVSTRFTVGDELQSIYGFRHADVEVFRSERRAAEAAPDTEAGREAAGGQLPLATRGPVARQQDRANAVRRWVRGAGGRPSAPGRGRRGHGRRGSGHRAEGLGGGRCARGIARRARPTVAGGGGPVPRRAAARPPRRRGAAR